MNTSPCTPSTSGRRVVQEQRHRAPRIQQHRASNPHALECALATRSPAFDGGAAARRPLRRVSVVAASAGSGSGSGGGGGGVVTREVLSRPERTKMDPGDDLAFYDFPRFVKHVDEGFLDQVTELYRQRIPEKGAVLDLCSSWVSHLPPEVFYSRVVGHGMNAAELARNPRLDACFVRDLNREPDGWPLEDRSLDAVLCCVSVQYLQQPERVFAEIYRVLKPGGVCIITFSNRMFYSKAIAAWRDASGYARCQLVRHYFQAVSGFTAPEVLTEVPKPGEGRQGAAGGSGADLLSGLLAPLTRLLRRSSSDPFYAVVAYRNFRREE